ncbi:hypothetical protein EDD26_1801 [Agrococcus jenensis]|uniref:Uncharacterized protein n=1 Tax=Agrococcus jenensis TaxID=46353 RepID=A0A3N2ATR1_9MICO|nr:hypothetical protein EDD26_1801 [Agrococcus jenensis]
MWTQRQARRVKAWLMLGLGLAILALVIPLVLRVYQQRWPDQGTRPLIVVATQGDGRPYTVQVRSEIDDAGEYRFRFAVELAEKSDSGAERAPIDFQLTLVGRGLEGAVSCGADAVAPSAVAAAELDPSTRRAYDIDRSSDLLSATGADVEESELAFLRIEGELSTIYAGDAVPALDASDGGRPLAHGCTIASTVLWATGGGSPMAAVRSTLFAPQFNATTIEGGDDELTGLQAYLWVERATSATIEDSYPVASPDSTGWSTWYTPSWFASDFLYTDQPTWLFENRDQSRFEQALLLFGGILLGLGLSLFQGGVSDLIEAHAREETAGQRGR